MGFFGKLFEKKECAICGGEIGLLGNRKLEDGNMCKYCAAQLSPWFSDRRNSTIAEIEEQLAYREENRRALEGFRPVYEIGDYNRIYADEVNGVPSRFLVSKTRDYIGENADLISFADVTSCRIDVDKDYRELKHSNDRNEMVSYNPPRFEYNYDFYVELGIANNPYFDEIRFQLNAGSVYVVRENFGPMRGGFGGFLSDPWGFDPSFDPEYREYMHMCEEVRELVDAGRRGAANLRQAAAVTDGEARRAKFCSNCGEPVGGGKFCPNCGNKL